MLNTDDNNGATELALQHDMAYRLKNHATLVTGLLRAFQALSWISFSLSSAARLASPVLASSFAHRVSPVRKSASWISFSLSSAARLASPVLASSFAHRVSPVRKSAAMTRNEGAAIHSTTLPFTTNFRWNCSCRPRAALYQHCSQKPPDTHSPEYQCQYSHHRRPSQSRFS